jgi:hypothetical protein
MIAIDCLQFCHFVSIFNFNFYQVKKYYEEHLYVVTRYLNIAAFKFSCSQSLALLRLKVKQNDYLCMVEDLFSIFI